MPPPNPNPPPSLPRDLVRRAIRAIDRIPFSHHLLLAALSPRAAVVALDLRRESRRLASARPDLFPDGPPSWVPCISAAFAESADHLAWTCRDRFSLPHWRARIHATGIDTIVQSVRAGRPVVVANIHTLPMRLLSWVLAARGLRVGVSLNMPETVSMRFRSGQPLKSGVLGPQLLDVRRPRPMLRFLETPGVLIVAADFPAGEQIRCPAGPWRVRVAAGPIKAAQLTRADLFVCTCRVQPPMNIVVDCQGPIPLAGNARESAAARIAAVIASFVRAHPLDYKLEELDALLSPALPHELTELKPVALETSVDHA